MGAFDTAKTYAQKLAEALKSAASTGAEMYGAASQPAPPEVVKGVLGFTPVAGDAISAYDAYDAAKQGNYGEAALNAVGLLPFVPSLGAFGHTAWHGSPHKFDKFALEKIGTGEGKQQQGVGAYLAEVKEVGQKYAERLAEMHGKDAGYLYKVDIPDDSMGRIAEYNKPFGQQTAEVKQAVLPLLDDQVKHNLLGYYGWETHEDAPMQAIMESIDIAKGNDRNATRAALLENGVLGVKYLDGVSRGANSGSSNFVMFDPNMIRILERNGQPTGLQPWKPGEWK